MERDSCSSDSSVHVKDEPECLFNHEERKTEVVVEIEHIKEEQEWDSASCVSEAEPSDLYPEHEVKDELTLGPEGLQPADVAFSLYAQSLAVKREPEVKDCVVMLEHIDLEAQPPSTENVTHPNTRQPLTSHIANNTDLAHEYNDTNEKEYYVCAICNWRFKLKSRLKEHVMVHIHVSMEEESVEMVLSETVEDRDHHGDHGYARTESPLPKVTAFECGTCNKKYKGLRQLQRHARTHWRVKPYSSSIVDKTVTESEEEIDVVSLGPQLPLVIPCDSPPSVRRRPQRTWHTRHRRCFPSAAVATAAPARYGLRTRKRRRLYSDTDSDRASHTQHTHTDTDRRATHNVKERFRRYCLKKLFDELRAQIPKIKGKDSASKIMIIREATALCHRLREQQMRLGKQQHQLMTEFKELRSMAKRVRL